MSPKRTEDIDFEKHVFQNIGRGLDDDIVVVRGYVADNMEQSGGILTEDAVWSFIKKVSHSNVEYEARVEGTPKHFAGVVYEELDRDIHIIEDFLVPRFWSFYESIDPAEGKPVAWSFFAVSPWQFELSERRTVNKAFQIGYLAIQGEPISEITRRVRIKRAELGYTRPIWVVLDAKYGLRTMQTGEDTTNWQTELRKFDPGIRYILSISKPGSLETGESIVKEYLKAKYDSLHNTHTPTFQIFRSCEHPTDSFNPISQMFNYAKDEDNPSKRTEEYKDFPDTIRYFLAKYPRYHEQSDEVPEKKQKRYFQGRR